MNPKTKWVIALAVVAVLAASVLLLRQGHAAAPITVSLRIAVHPQDQADFVAAQANSARFKYLAGKQAGVKPELAQKLAVKRAPNVPELEAELRVLTREDAERYIAGFIETLQVVCGNQAQVALARQSIR